MIDIAIAEPYIVYIVWSCLGLYIIYSMIYTKRAKVDGSLIESLNVIAQSLDSGNSIESAIMEVSKDKKNPSAKYFKKIIDEANKGKSFEDALRTVSKETKSDTFAYICDIILLAQRAKGNIADSLKKLSQNLWDIDHLQTSVNSKASGPITTLKILGIIIIPLIYYGLAAVISSDTVAIEITWSFKLYFAAIAVALTFTDYFLFADWMDGTMLLPFSLSYVVLIWLKVRPFISGYMGIT